MSGGSHRHMRLDVENIYYYKYYYHTSFVIHKFIFNRIHLELTNKLVHETSNAKSDKYNEIAQ